MNIPKISIIIPTLGRPEGLKRCLDSICRQVYPRGFLEVIVIEDSPRIGVPLRLKQGVERSTGEYIVFGSNDIEFDALCLWEAFICAGKTGKRLISFNTGDLLSDNGNICEHFMIHRSLIELLTNKEIFDTRFHHVGVDNYLWAQCYKLNEAIRCESAKAKHYHFSKGAPMDEVYQMGWSHVEQDRALLRKLIAEL